jgi:hypothetical protein
LVKKFITRDSDGFNSAGYAGVLNPISRIFDPVPKVTWNFSGIVPKNYSASFSQRHGSRPAKVAGFIVRPLLFLASRGILAQKDSLASPPELATA